ncbi:MAG: hypothetical protein C0404_14540 [Verrucomicrobia bacterium]|nr:hypothetical protein [Verrucomicrobiota bacterium]
MKQTAGVALMVLAMSWQSAAADGFPKPYSPPCVERENVFEFTEKPAVKTVGQDRYEIAFAAKGNCDVTVAIIDPEGKVVRHVASGVLGVNAPAPLQKNSLKQTLLWNGKDDLDNYVKEPLRMRVRVMLGLKPAFDKLLGGTSPLNLPGEVQGIVVNEEGGFVFSKDLGSHGHSTLRMFDRDGKYMRSVIPPPSNLTPEKAAGLSYIEYEEGKKALHGADVYETVAKGGFWTPGLDGRGLGDIQPAIIGKRLFFCNGGVGYHGGCRASLLFSWNTDGSTELKGMRGRPLAADNKTEHVAPRFAASPDGKRLYVGGITEGYYGSHNFVPMIMWLDPEGIKPAVLFAGDPKVMGSDEKHFNCPSGLDCDAAGRVYVADQRNNRLQVLSPEGKFLKTLEVDRPDLVRVHQKTGAIYILHQARVEGRSVPRLTKFASFDDLKEVYHVDGLTGKTMAVDSWSAKPRIWLGRGRKQWAEERSGSFSVRIYEEDGNALKVAVDFDEEARKEAGANYMGRWGGSIGGKVVCDPLREKLFYNNGIIFDLATGRRAGRISHPGPTDDIAFDKHGYLHAHFNPGFFLPGVGRFDVDNIPPDGRIKEVPYDYGIEAPGAGFRGIMPVRDQLGAKYFQDGFGVNMRGEVAEQCNIYYVPKMDDLGKDEAMQGTREFLNKGFWDEEANNFAASSRKIEDAIKRGEEVYSIRREPGVPLSGGTVWTFNRNGEIKGESIVTAGKLINGTMIDEDGAVYFVTGRPKLYDGKIFLYARGGTYGAPGDKLNGWPFTGTLVKTVVNAKCRIVQKNAPIHMEETPNRPPEVSSISFVNDEHDNKSIHAWVEGAEWLYAGASPIVSGGCSCPTQRLHTDWFKRTFVPEAYRHSIGILDASGNLVLHVGSYGTLDDVRALKAGSTDIPMLFVRFVSATDNYMCFDDWNERLVVLKLGYHAEETVEIK